MITIYSLENCGYSRAAEDMARTSGYDFIIYKVKQSEKNKYKKQHNYNTFPHVFINGHLIGGATEFKAWLSQRRN